MNEPEIGSVVKSGICWFELSMTRKSRGLEMYVRTVPQIEEFVKSLGDGSKDLYDVYGRGWTSLTPGSPLKLYSLTNPLASQSYTVQHPTEPLKTRDGRVNLSFLRIAGISEPQGVTFLVSGPFSRDFVSELSASLISETRNLIREYIVPVHINLRISSQEL